MRTWLLRLIVLAALVAAGFALRFTVFASEPIRVEVAVVGRGTVEATVANTKAGTVQARRRAKLSPGTSGLVAELLVTRGQHVTAGDVLLRIDAATQRAQLALTQRALEVADARNARACLLAERAARELERNQEAGDDIVSEDRLDQLKSARDLATADCTVAAAEVERARASVAAAQAEVDKTELKAPFDAVVAEVDFELGEWVTPSVPLVVAPDTIDAVDPSSLYISAPIDELEASRLRVGQPARVTIDSHPGQTFAGSIVAVAPYVLDLEQQNRTIEIEVELEDQTLSASLLPGTSADVEVVLETKQDALRVPTFAVLDGRRALVVAGDVVEERAVTLGLRSWEHVEILSGLEAGEHVVVRFEADDLAAGAEVVVAAPGGDE